jgi:RES domain-containing protein
MRLDPTQHGHSFSLDVWRQCRPARDLLAVEDPPSYSGRFHRVGDRATWYASLTEQDAWAQFFRHHPRGGVDPFEVRRRIGAAHVEDLLVLDLTDPRLRRLAGITVKQLRSNRYAACQALGRAARAAGFEGILAPSAALPAERTLVVFDQAVRKVRELHSSVATPPAVLRGVRRKIRRAPWAARSRSGAGPAPPQDGVSATRWTRSPTAIGPARNVVP